jgi:hypothetical protein
VDLFILSILALEDSYVDLVVGFTTCFESPDRACPPWLLEALDLVFVHRSRELGASNEKGNDNVPPLCTHGPKTWCRFSSHPTGEEYHLVVGQRSTLTNPLNAGLCIIPAGAVERINAPSPSAMFPTQRTEWRAGIVPSSPN